MAVLTEAEITRLEGTRPNAYLYKKLRIFDRLALLDTDGTIAGGFTSTDFTATNQDKITLANSETDGKFAISVNTTGTNHTVTLKAPVTSQTVTLTLPDVAADTLVGKTTTDTLTNKTLTTPTIADFTNATHNHSNTATGGALSADTATTGTTSNTFDIDSDNTTGILQVKTTTGGTNHTVVLTNATTTAARTITLPDLTGTVALLTGAQTFASKTLTAPVINAATITGAITITTPTVTGTWTNLGTVTTVNIDGGTIDAAAIGGSTPAAGAFTTLAASGATTLSDDVTVAANKDIALTKGTGYIQINAETSGAMKFLPAAATAQTVTIATAAQTVGPATVSIPDMAGVSTTFVLAGATQTFTAAQSVTSDDTTDGVVDLLTLTHSSSDNNATAGDGIGLSFKLENATGTSLVEEWASIDVVSTTITNASEDGDILVKQMLGGAVTQSLLLDASAQEVVIGSNATYASGMSGLRIYPVTASSGSLVLTATAHASADRATTITNATDSGAAVTITLPNATSTLSGIGLAETFSGVKTFSAAPIIHYSGTDTNAVRDLLTIKNESSGTPAAGLGIGLSFQITDLTGATVEEQASMDVKLATATSTAEDVDIVFSQNLAGTITPTVTFDSINQEVVIGQDATDANGMHGLRIWPLTAARGSILIQPTDNTGDDTVTLTNTNTGGDITITLPATTSTLATLAANTYTAAQTVAYSASGTNAIYDALVLSQETDGTPAAGLGVGISFKITDLTEATPEEQGSLDLQLATATSTAEDADFVFSQNLAGTITQTFKLDSVNQQAVIGRDASDANGMYRLRIYPVTTASGSVILSATASTGDFSTTITNADMGQSTVVSIPDPGAATGTFALVDIAQTFAGAQTFTAKPVISINDASNTSVTDVLQLTHTTSGAAGANIGAGISVIIENDTDDTTESASIDWVTTNDGTKASLDTDVVFSTMLGGALQPALTIDASAQEVIIGQNVTDADGMQSLRIFPVTTAKGSLVLQAAANSAGDVKVIIQNGQSAAESTFTLPTVTSGNFALCASAAGAIARADITEDALQAYGIPLMQIMAADGAPLGLSESAGDHFISFGTNIIQLQGEEAISETETSESYWQFVLPPEYVAAGDVTVRLRCKVDGAGTDNGSTVDVEVFEQADGAIGSDIQATAPQTFAAKGTWYNKDFSVTAAGLVAGDILNVVLTTAVTEIAAGALAFYADPPKMLLDVKG